MEYKDLPTKNGQKCWPEELAGLPDDTRIELRNLVGGTELYHLRELKDDTWPMLIERFTHYRVVTE